MENYVEKDCFILEISVSPGGMRLAEIYIYVQQQNIYNIIDFFLKEPYGMHVLARGGILDLYVIKNGKITECIDLYDYIQVHFYGYELQRANTKMFFDIVEEIEQIADGAYEFEDLQDKEFDLFIQKSGFDLDKLNTDTFQKDFLIESPLHKAFIDWEKFKEKLDAIHFENPLKIGEKIRNTIFAKDTSIKVKDGYFKLITKLAIGAHNVEAYESVNGGTLIFKPPSQINEED